MKTIIVTGSSGLIGSEVCQYFDSQGWSVHGVDNNQRAVFFGDQRDARCIQHPVRKSLKAFSHHEIDIRDRIGICNLIDTIRPHAIVHAAAQPSHDRASAIPFEDFDTNAVGTFNLLEATRRYSLNVPFVYMSTNKVYGDAPNEIKLAEQEMRWEYDDVSFKAGIPETLRVDQAKHSLFGASKLAADIAVQEYGKYFGMPTVCLRGGCLTGPCHSGVELHGFLSYLIKCNLEGKIYNVYGYKGKQVRDNIHAFDVACFIGEFIQSPRAGEVYNIGGGKENSCSIIEAFKLIGKISGKEMVYNYLDENRNGDHICYYSDLTKLRSHYPGWRITKNLEQIFVDIYEAWQQRKKNKN